MDKKAQIHYQNQIKYDVVNCLYKADGKTIDFSLDLFLIKKISFK